MDRLTNVVVLWLLVGLSSLALAQSKPQLDQKVGNCSVIQNGTGNTVSLNCDNIDATLARQIQEILNSTRQNTSAAKGISEKLDRIINHMDQESVPPVVGLRFVYPKSPALLILNESAVVARDIKWTVVLWNMDLPERTDPLPIPVSIFDWLKGHDEGGPQNLFDNPTIIPLLKSGNRLIGSASITCPNCERGRTYLIYIVWGEGGWYSELEGEKSGHIVAPLKFEREALNSYFGLIESAVPAEKRVPISDSLRQ